jgi:hypothetical protein
MAIGHGTLIPGTPVVQLPFINAQTMQLACEFGGR